MSKSKKIAAAALMGSLAFLGSCSPTAAPPSGSGGEEALSSPYAITHAKNFSIEYLAGGAKIVTDSAGQKLALVPEGAEEPAEAAGLQTVQTPIKSSVCLSTTFVGLMASLGEEAVFDTVVGVATDRQDWTTPQIVKRFDEGKVKYLLDSNYSTDVEGIIGLRPDVVFIVGGQEEGMNASQKLSDVGIANMQITEYQEEGALAYVEWVKFFGAFFNMDEKADQVFKAKDARLSELHALASKIADSDRPVIAYGNLYNGSIYTPGADSAVAQEIAAAGGKYYLESVSGAGSVQLTMEEFLSSARTADILIYTSMTLYTPDKGAIAALDPLFAELKAYKDGKVYGLAKSYYMEAAQNDVKFQELVNIAQPSLNLGSDEVFYEKLK